MDSAIKASTAISDGARVAPCRLADNEQRSIHDPPSPVIKW
jgi:hypothetical protein